jgi:type VI secretion system protein ImpJ
VNTKRPLFWHQGLFLQPQHLQYADAHNAWVSSALDRGIHPNHWGVVDLELNEARLNSGVVEIDRAALLLRDGSLIDVPDNAVVASRDFRAEWGPDEPALGVWLGVRRLAETETNVTVVADREAATRASTRFASLADAAPMPDLHQGREESVQVKTMHYVLRLFWEHELEQLEDYDVLPIARLSRDGETVQLDPGFAPPALTVAAVPALVRTLREIREQVVGRAHQLEEYKGPGSGGGSSEFSPKLMRYRFALQVLGRYAPAIAHCTETPQLHPCDVYGLLRQLIGELSAFSTDMDVLGTPVGHEEGMPPYDHHRAGAQFREARLTIERLLNSITVGPEYIVDIENTAYGRFECELPRHFLDRRATLYLALRTAQMSDALLESFTSFAKIGAAHEVDLFVRRALPGLGTTYLKVRPESLPQRPNTHYFRLEQHDTLWEGVENTRTLAVLWDAAPDDLKIELIMVRV